MNGLGIERSTGGFGFGIDPTDHASTGAESIRKVEHHSRRMAVSRSAQPFIQ